MKKTNRILRAAAVLLLLTAGLGSCQEADEYGDAVLMTGTSSDPMVSFAIDALPSAYSVTVSSTTQVSSPVTAQVAVDPSLVEAYNAKMGTNYYPIPEVVIKGEYSHRFLKSQYDDEPSVSLGVAYAGFFTK